MPEILSVKFVVDQELTICNDVKIPIRLVHRQAQLGIIQHNLLDVALKVAHQCKNPRWGLVLDEYVLTGSSHLSPLHVIDTHFIANETINLNLDVCPLPKREVDRDLPSIFVETLNRVEEDPYRGGVEEPEGEDLVQIEEAQIRPRNLRVHRGSDSG